MRNNSTRIAAQSLLHKTIQHDDYSRHYHSMDSNERTPPSNSNKRERTQPQREAEQRYRLSYKGRNTRQRYSQATKDAQKRYSKKYYDTTGRSGMRFHARTCHQQYLDIMAIDDCAYACPARHEAASETRRLHAMASLMFCDSVEKQLQQHIHALNNIHGLSETDIVARDAALILANTVITLLEEWKQHPQQHMHSLQHVHHCIFETYQDCVLTGMLAIFPNSVVQPVLHDMATWKCPDAPSASSARYYTQWGARELNLYLDAVKDVLPPTMYSNFFCAADARKHWWWLSTKTEKQLQEYEDAMRPPPPPVWEYSSFSHEHNMQQEALQ